MRLLTLNTHSWMEEEPTEKLQQLVNQILTAKYDVIALQEVNQQLHGEVAIPNLYYRPTQQDVPLKEDNFALLLQRQLLAEGLAYYWSWQPNHIGYDMYDEGVALLSLSPFTTVKGFQLSKGATYTDYRTRFALGAQVAGHSEWFYSLHFSWWGKDHQEAAFQYEWQQFLKQLSATGGFLMGDFNNPADGPGYQLITNTAAVTDSFIVARQKNGEHTVLKAIDGWENSQEKLRIDYIWVPETITVEHYQVLFDGIETPIVSDHFGIEVLVE